MARRQPKLSLPSLDAGPVPLASIRNTAKRLLLDVVDSKRGRKALILEPSISGPVTLLDGSLSELLTEHGVVKLLYLEQKPLDDISYNQAEPRLVDIRSVIYIVRSTIENAQLIAWQIKNSNRHPATEYAVYFVPRRTVACERVLEEEGIYGDIQLGEYPLDMIPYDDDVISLELESAFKDCVLEGDSTSLYYAARAIMRLQSMFGLVGRIQGKGPAAAAVRDVCMKMRKEMSSASFPSVGPGSPRISRLILLDREVDVVTPLMTQITFEGVIDEITGIRHGAVPLTSGEGGEGARQVRGSLMMNSADPFFKEFRDLPYDVASQRLQQCAREAKTEYEGLSKKDLSELKSFVKGLPKVMMLDRLSDAARPAAEVIRQQTFHDRLAQEKDIVDNYEVEATVTFVQELMYQGAELLEVLRLLVLLSLTNNGFSKKHYDALRTEVLHTYGHQHMLTLDNLETSGLLKQHVSGRGAFSSLKRTFRLIVPQDDPLYTTDIATLYKGYAPLSIRLIEHALEGTWPAVADSLALLAGPQFDFHQSVDSKGQFQDKPVRQAGAASLPGGPETVLVFFLGGVTFTEISALRFLSAKSKGQYNFLVATTKIINGNTLLQPFIDPAAPGQPKSSR